MISDDYTGCYWEPSGELRRLRVFGAGGRLLGEHLEQKWYLRNWTFDYEPSRSEEWCVVREIDLPLVNEHLHWLELK